jgi:hypothetical protein
MSVRELLLRCLWAAAALGVLLVLAVPAPDPASVKSPAGGETWTPPRFASASSAAADLAELQRGNLWGGALQTETAVDERARRWRLAAIAGQARDRHLVVQFGDERILPLKAGDRLPDGTLIGDIRDTGICVIIDGKKRLLPRPGQTLPTIW